jgi:hypothetical protein
VGYDWLEVMNILSQIDALCYASVGGQLSDIANPDELPKFNFFADMYCGAILESQDFASDIMVRVIEKVGFKTFREFTPPNIAVSGLRSPRQVVKVIQAGYDASLHTKLFEQPCPIWLSWIHSAESPAEMASFLFTSKETAHIVSRYDCVPALHLTLGTILRDLLVTDALDGELAEAMAFVFTSLLAAGVIPVPIGATQDGATSAEMRCQTQLLASFPFKLAEIRAMHSTAGVSTDIPYRSQLAFYLLKYSARKGVENITTQDRQILMSILREPTVDPVERANRVRIFIFEINVFCIC